MRVPDSLVAGCILSKCPDGRKCPLTLKRMVGYIWHLPEMSFWYLCTSQHSRKAKKGKKQVHVPTCSEKEPNKEEEERSVIDEWSSEEEIED